MIPAYPKVISFGGRVVLDRNHEYYVEEKMDGSQFSFGVVDGVLECRSKSVMIDMDSVPGNFLPAVQTAQVLFAEGLLNRGLIYRGEAICKPKQNTLTYSRMPRGSIVLFDVEDSNGIPAIRAEKEIEAAAIGLEVVPVLWRGKVADLDVAALLDNESYLGGPKIEGFVVKSDEPQWIVYGGKEQRLQIKYVSEAFKEFHSKSWRSENPGRKDALSLVVSEIKSEARWHKAIQHMRDEGRLTDSVKDIGPLVAEIQRDLFDDDADEVGRILLKHFRPLLVKEVLRGFAEYYKGQLFAAAIDVAED